MSDETPTTDTAEVEAALLDYLRTARPSGLTIVTREGKSQKLSLRTGKSRWTIAARVIVRQLDDVERVLLLDRQGGTVDVWNPPEPVDPEAEQHERERLDEAKVPGPLKPLLSLGRLMNDHADRQVDRIMRNQRELFALMLDTMKLTNARLEAYDRSHANILTTLYDATKREAQLEGLLKSGALKPATAGDADDPNEGLIVAVLARALGMDPAQLAQMAAQGQGGPQLATNGTGGALPADAGTEDESTH